MKKEVFERIGLFEPHIKSGGDFVWTRRALDHQFEIYYLDTAIIYHPARRIEELLRKNIRLGMGTIDKWHEQGVPWRSRLKVIVRLLIPSRISYINSLVDKNKSEPITRKKVSIWFVCYICRLYFLKGVLHRLWERAISNENSLRK